MTEEQKEIIKDLVKFRTYDPFENEESEKKTLNKLRIDALHSIQEYKNFKDRIKRKEKEKQTIQDLIKAIDLIKTT